MTDDDIITSFTLLRTTDQSPAAVEIRKLFYEHFRQTVYVNLQRNADLISMPSEKKLAIGKTHPSLY